MNAYEEMLAGYADPDAVSPDTDADFCLESMSLCCKRNTCERFPLTKTTVHNEYIATQKLRVIYRIYAIMGIKFALKRSLFKVLEPSRVRVGVNFKSIFLLFVRILQYWGREC